MSQQVDTIITVLIVGAGPTGLVLAIELARRGIPCRIIDKEPQPSQISKALVIHARTLEVCEQLGVIDEMLSLGCRIRYFNIHSNGHSLVKADFQTLKSPYPCMLNLDQSETEQILERRLNHLGGQVERSVSLVSFTQDAQHVLATLRHADGREELVTASWLVGCDGAHSTVRQQLGVPFLGDASPESFVFVDGQVDTTLANDGMHLFLHRDGFFGVFPLPHGRHRLAIRNEVSGEEQKLPEPTEEQVQRYLAERGPRGAKLHDIAWVSRFYSRERIVQRYRQERVFLAGDAAHIHSPAGGQGMNTGIQDAYNLGWKIAFVELCLSPVSILDTYEEERLAVAQAAIQSSRILLRLNSLQNPFSKFIRNSLISCIGKLNILPVNVLERISSLGVEYRTSSLVEHVQESGRQAGKYVHAGDRAPDATVIREDGERRRTQTRLFELFRMTEYTVLLFTGTKRNKQEWSSWQVLVNDLRTRYGNLFTVFFVVAGATAPAGIDPQAVLFDPQGDLHHLYGVQQCCLYLVRPDTYIGFRNQPMREDAFLAYVQKICVDRESRPGKSDDQLPTSSFKESYV